MLQCEYINVFQIDTRMLDAVKIIFWRRSKTFRKPGVIPRQGHNLCLPFHPCTCFGRFKIIWPSFHGFDFQVYYPQGREISVKEAKYSSRLDQLLIDRIVWGALFRVAPAVTCYLRTLPYLARGGARPGVPQESWNDIAKFWIFCLEVLRFFLIWTKYLETEFICQIALCRDADVMTVLWHVNCVFRYTCSSFHCFGHAWSTVSVLLSYVNLTVFKSTKQCLCIKFHEKIGKMASLTHQMMYIIFRMKQKLRVEFLHGCKILERNVCSKSDKCCGCLSASRNDELVAHMHDLVWSHRWIPQEMAEKEFIVTHVQLF
jgi:hypothetical protein